MHDLVIRSGTVVDGTGSARVTADVAVDGDVIVQVGPGRRLRDERDRRRRGSRDTRDSSTSTPTTTVRSRGIPCSRLRAGTA